MKIIVATQNSHKAIELKEMLNMKEIELLTMKDLNINLDIEENGKTFEENALIKARTLYNELNDENIIVMADDSGLCVDALNGAPGIFSARYSGGNSKDNNNKLLKELKNVPFEKRTAHFTCCIAIVSKNIEKTFIGKCNGIITTEEKGNNDFGYDPLFYYPEFKKTFGEISSEEKNKVSHRANAINLLKEWLLKNI